MRNLIRQILREEQEVKKGDKLMSTKTVKNSRTAGKVYTVVGVQNNPHGEDEILFVNDRGVLLHFPISEYKDSFVPFDYDNTSDIFNQLKEHIERKEETFTNKYGEDITLIKGEDGTILFKHTDYKDKFIPLDKLYSPIMVRKDNPSGFIVALDNDEKKFFNNFIKGTKYKSLKI